jgi:hypothetical protein
MALLIAHHVATNVDAAVTVYVKLRVLNQILKKMALHGVLTIVTEVMNLGIAKHGQLGIHGLKQNLKGWPLNE